MRGDYLFATQTILRREHGAVVEFLANGREGGFGLGGLGGDDAEIAIGKFLRICSGEQRRFEVMLARDAQAIFAQRTSMLGAADEGVNLDVFELRQMRGVKAADGAAADDADFTNHTTRVSAWRRLKIRVPRGRWARSCLRAALSICERWCCRCCGNHQ